MKSLKAFVLGGVFLAVSQAVEVFGGSIDPSFNKLLVGAGAVLVVLGGIFYVFDH